MWLRIPLDEGFTWTIPACVSSALNACQEDSPLDRPDMHTLLQNDEWQHVAAVRTQHLCWAAECRLRTTSWYSYYTTLTLLSSC